MQLFIARSQRVHRQRALSSDEVRAAIRICQLVEGIPLALELAAAAHRELEYTAIAGAIATDIDVLQLNLRDQPARHHSVRAVFEHSWRLLRPGEQQTLARLAFFVVALMAMLLGRDSRGDPPTASTLVDKSLVRRDEGARYGLLELIRHFAYEKLQAMEAEQRSGIPICGTLWRSSKTAEPELQRANQETWMQRLEEEHDNLRAALQAGIEHDEVELSRHVWRGCCGASGGSVAISMKVVVGSHQLLRHSLSSEVQAKVLSGAGALSILSKRP